MRSDLAYNPDVELIKALVICAVSGRLQSSLISGYRGVASQDISVSVAPAGYISDILPCRVLRS